MGWGGTGTSLSSRPDWLTKQIPGYTAKPSLEKLNKIFSWKTNKTVIQLGRRIAIPMCGSICKTHFWKRQVREKAQVAARVDWGEAADNTSQFRHTQPQTICLKPG